MGLMGGAIANALRSRCGVAQAGLYACDADPGALSLAEKAGFICKGWAPDDAGKMLADCDLVFLCVNPSSLLEFLSKWEQTFKPGALITDIAGTKIGVAKAAENIRSDLDFIPGHPMAGAEKGGFINQALCDFRGKNYILTPLARNKPENLQFLKNLIHRMGFDRITETNPADHDTKIAFTSQLCHVIAASLVNCEADSSITRFGGGSLEDLTRIAIFNAPMWTELFISNREALLEWIERFETSLDGIKSLIQEEKAEDLELMLARVRERRTSWSSARPAGN